MKACGGRNGEGGNEYSRLEPWQNTQPGNSSQVSQTEGFSRGANLVHAHFSRQLQQHQQQHQQW